MPEIKRYFQTPTSRAITEIFAWVCTEPDGSEGIAGANLPEVGWIALVGGDLDRMQSLRPYAETIRRSTGFPVKLVRFSTRTELETLP